MIIKSQAQQAVPGPSRFINKSNNRYNYINAQGNCVSTGEATGDPNDPTLAIDRDECGECEPFVTECN